MCCVPIFTMKDGIETAADGMDPISGNNEAILIQRLEYTCTKASSCNVGSVFPRGALPRCQ